MERSLGSAMKSIILSNLGSGIGLIPDYLGLGRHGGHSGTALLVLASASACAAAAMVGKVRHVLHSFGEATASNLPSSFDA